MPKGRHPNSLKALSPWVPGQTGNPHGSRSIGATIREWLNVLSGGNGGKTASIGQLRAILEAPDDDKRAVPTKRIAARRILDAISSEHGSRSDAAWLVDNTDGAAVQRAAVIVSGEVHTKHVHLVPPPNTHPTIEAPSVVVHGEIEHAQPVSDDAQTLTSTPDEPKATSTPAEQPIDGLFSGQHSNSLLSTTDARQVVRLDESTDVDTPPPACSDKVVRSSSDEAGG